MKQVLGAIFVKLKHQQMDAKNRELLFATKNQECIKRFADYKGPCASPLEKERIAALHDCGILDTEPEELFNCLASTIRLVCQCSSSAIAFVDEHRVWSKASYGCSQDICRVQSPCDNVVASGQPLVVCNMSEDAYFKNHPFAKDVGNFFAGVPIFFQSFVIGMLPCVPIVNRNRVCV